ncbi:hypothetical protein G7Y89_g5333 [Cudoniella acicularis]|uniref:Transcription factor RfeG n=1 Tax=Cudoniella acicularis TaxID=354080 RepID=A0A8H4RMN4_9HELO|nr:hypothetical protein G7Y89_g5333 [Cudoniella acicularis]
MSRRDERDRTTRGTAQASARTNEYFVPKDGIDREVITADICRYLGNDALVRPGSYENPGTRQIQQGYYITAYRNLTTAMIADLKADSERWEAERRATSSSRGGQPSNVEYRASTTHQSRQYYGPTEAAPANTPGGHSNASSSTMGGSQQEVSYGNPGYAPSSGGYSQPVSSPYPPSSTGYTQDYPNYAVGSSGVSSNPYIAGGFLEPEQTQRARNPPMQQSMTDNRGIPRSNYTPTSAAYQEGRGGAPGYYPPPPAQQVQATGPYGQPSSANPYYDRAPPAAGYDIREDDHPQSYQENTAYSQPPMASTPATANQGATRRNDREPDRERERRRRHH